MKLTILPDKKLRKASEIVELPLTIEDQELIEDMIKYIDSSKDDDNELRAGVGIAAPQLGSNKRMFYINMIEDADGHEFKEFLINPEIIAESAITAALEGGEGCLSVPEDWKGTKGLVHRKFKIKVRGYSYFKKEVVEITKSGYPAIVIQHEYDHLNGKIFTDRIVNGKEWTPKKDEVLI